MYDEPFALVLIAGCLAVIGVDAWRKLRARLQRRPTPEWRNLVAVVDRARSDFHP